MKFMTIDGFRAGRTIGVLGPPCASPVKVLVNLLFSAVASDYFKMTAVAIVERYIKRCCCRGCERGR
jgi:hypothetical protein